MDKVSYIIGRQIGGDFKTQGIEAKVSSFVKGFESALEGSDSEISAGETQDIMNAFQVEMAAKTQKLAAEAGEKNVEAGKTYYIRQKMLMGIVVARSKLELLNEIEGSEMLSVLKHPKIKKRKKKFKLDNNDSKKKEEVIVF